MTLKSGSVSDVIREVLSRTCGKAVRDADGLKTDLKLGCSDCAELLVALELALRFEIPAFEIDGEITVADLVALIAPKGVAA